MRPFAKACKRTHGNRRKVTGANAIRLGKEDGAAYIELLISMLIIFTLLAAFVSIPPIFICKQNMDYVGRKLVREVETSGEIGAQTESLCKHLSAVSGTEVKITGWEADFIDGTRKVQLRDEFALMLECSYKAEIISLFGQTISVSIPLSGRFKGISEVYHK